MLTEPQLKQHVTVHAAYVEALCICEQVHEAMRAFEQMLELYAAQYHPEDSQEAETHSKPLRSQSDALTSECSIGPGSSSISIDTQQLSESHNCSHQSQSLEQRCAGISEAAAEQLGATGPDASSAAEPTSLAHRAAQAACHQVLSAMAKGGLARLSCNILRALHQVQHAAEDDLGLGLHHMSRALRPRVSFALQDQVILGLLVPSYEGWH